MIGVILAAGQGTRMKALTAVRPKAMLPVAGLPVIARVVSQLRAAGITDIIVVVAAQDRHIRPYFEAHPSGRPPLQFVTQPVAGGMADALLYAAPHIQTPFILTACDSLYPDDHYRRLAQTHAAGNSPATLTLMELPPEEISRAGSVQLARGRVMRIVEKPPPGHAPSNIASLALYAFDTALLEYLHRIERSSRGELELQDAIQLLITDQGGLPGLMTPWRWELTAPADLLDMKAYTYSRDGNGKG
ncbi:MAG: sugar phosphate nucleotidyltransferase, partial [Anaerolineae bacterium]